MKRQNSLKKIGILVGAFFLFATLFTACKKAEQTRLPVAHLMAYNMIPDQTGVVITIDNNSITNTAFTYPSYTAGYRNVYVGNRNLAAYVYNTQKEIFSAAQNFKDSSFYSLFLVGTDGHYKHIITEDDLNALPTNTSNAFIRYVNGITGNDLSSIKITSGATDAFDDENNTGSVSDIKQVAAGQISVTVSNPGSAEPVSKTFDVEKNGVYTILVIGVPGSTGDDAKPLDVKLVKLGNVAP